MWNKYFEIRSGDKVLFKIKCWQNLKIDNKFYATFITGKLVSGRPVFKKKYTVDTIPMGLEIEADTSIKMYQKLDSFLKESLNGIQFERVAVEY